MRHVITGGSGFVGTYLVRALADRGGKVTVFDVNPPTDLTGVVEFVPGDIRNASDIRKLNLDAHDIVYHLAARQFHLKVPRLGRDRWFADVNMGGTHELLRAMSTGSSRRLVLFSTDMVYGTPGTSPVTNAHPLRPIGPYGRSKVAAERLIGQARGDFGLKASVFRPRLIAGAGRLGILRRLFALIRRGLPVPLVGSGRNYYQMVAVEDCVSAALAAVERGCPEGPFNLGSDNPPTVQELLRNVIERAKSNSPLVPVPAMLLKPTLRLLDQVGLTLLYPEQLTIADLDYVLDTMETKNALSWQPSRSDADILFAAYRDFVQT